MKRKTLSEEIARIKLLNELMRGDTINSDDYLYDPEYYEARLQDDVPDDEDDDEDEEGLPFQDDLIVSPNAQTVSPISKSSEPESIQKKVKPKWGFENYDEEKTDKIHKLLSKNKLMAQNIPFPVFSALLKDNIIKFIPFEKKPESKRWHSYYRTDGSFGFMNGYEDDAAKSLIDNTKNFNIYFNNVIDEYNKMVIKDPDSAAQDHYVHLPHDEYIKLRKKYSKK